jgi:hypothetical protein
MGHGSSLSRTAPVEATNELFFQGATAGGAMGLTLARERAARKAATEIRQVLRLAQAEPLVVEIERWLRSDWDPVPCGNRDDAIRHGYQATVRDPALAPLGTILHLSLEALLAASSLPRPLCASALTWSAHTADLILSSVPASVLERLEPGALVWLPRAFAPKWIVSLCDPIKRLPTRFAQLNLATQQLEVPVGTNGDPPPASAPLDDDSLPLVRLAQRVQVPLDQWLGFGGVDRPFRWPVPQPWAVELCHAGITLGRGGLLPLSQGYGMLLESVETPVTI